MSDDELLPTKILSKTPTTPPNPLPTSNTWWKRIVSINTVGIALLAFAGIWSLSSVLSIQHQDNAPDVKIIRISHWQLESGYRDAMQSVIDDYNTMHKDQNVRIVQTPVTERIYAQWLNVNLISDSGPDLAEMGMSRLVSSGETIAKYFIPIGQDIGKPNPYNQPEYLDELSIHDPQIRDRLINAPWRETVVDGMRGGYRTDLQDYYSVSSSFFTTRIFYNKNMLKKAVGSEDPPHTLKELFDISDKLREWAKANGKRFDPIAAAKTNRDTFLNPYRVAMTASYATTVDTDLSGDISALEAWAGYQSKKVTLSDPAMTSSWELSRRICGLFNPQFAALDRDMAIADFAQERAAFMASGSWDAQSVFDTCHFDVGVAPFPMPAPGEQYAEFGTLPYNEAGTVGGGSFGITKTSKHPEIALDFLRFLSSHKWNQRLNVKAGWLPVTVGAIPKPIIAAFMPNPYGVSADVGFADGFDLAIKVNQSVDRYLGGEKGFNYPEFTTAIETSMNDPVIGIDKIWAKNVEKCTDNMRSLERTIAIQSFRSLAGTGTPTTAKSIRETILDQAINNNGANIKLLYERYNHKPLTGEETATTNNPFQLWRVLVLAAVGLALSGVVAFTIHWFFGRRSTASSVASKATL